MIKKDIEAILKNKIFYVCLIIISGYYLVQTSFAWGFNDAAGFLFSAIYSNISILPLIIGLPSSFLIYEEFTNGNILMSLPRTSRKKYIASKLFAGWLQGFLLTFLSLSLFLLFIIFMAKEPMDFTGQYYYSQGVLGWLVRHNLGNLSIPLSLFLISCYGGNWPMMGIAVAALINNRYAVIFVPYLMIQVLSHILGRLNLERFSDGFFYTLIFNHVENEVFMEIAYSLFWFTIAFIMLMIGLNKKRNTGIWKN